MYKEIYVRKSIINQNSKNITEEIIGMNDAIFFRRTCREKTVCKHSKMLQHFNGSKLQLCTFISNSNTIRKGVIIRMMMMIMIIVKIIIYTNISTQKQ